MLNLSVMVWPFMSSDNGERRYLYFSLNIWFHECHLKEVYYVQNTSCNGFVYQLLIDLKFCLNTFLSFIFLYFFWLSFSLIASLYNLSLSFMDVFIPLITHGFSSSFLTFLLPCFMGAGLSRVLLNKWKNVWNLNLSHHFWCIETSQSILILYWSIFLHWYFKQLCFEEKKDLGFLFIPIIYKYTFYIAPFSEESDLVG